MCVELNINSEYAARINASIHSIAVSYLALDGLYHYNTMTKTEHIYLTLDISSLSFAYVIVDMWLLYIRQKIDIMNIIHHIAMMAAMLYSIVFNFQWFLLLGITSEITTPFLHYAYYCKEEKITQSLSFKICSIMLIVLYFIFRIVNFGFLTIYPMWLENYYGISIIMGTLWIMNISWFNLLCSKAYKYLSINKKH